MYNTCIDLSDDIIFKVNLYLTSDTDAASTLSTNSGALSLASTMMTLDTLVAFKCMMTKKALG